MEGPGWEGLPSRCDTCCHISGKKMDKHPTGMSEGCLWPPGQREKGLGHVSREGASVRAALL